MGTSYRHVLLPLDGGLFQKRDSHFQWSERDEYAVPGSRRMDCIGRWESDQTDREIASQSCEVAATECGQRRSFNRGNGFSEIEGKAAR